MGVGDIDLNHLKTGLVCDSSEGLNADLGDDGSVDQSFIVEDPNDLGKGEPLRMGGVDEGPFAVLFDEGKASIGEEQLLSPRSVPNHFPLSVPHLFQPTVKRLPRKRPKDV